MPSPKDPQKAKEWREKLVLAWKNPERRELMSKILKERKFSREHKKKISLAAKKRIGNKTLSMEKNIQKNLN